MLFPFRGLDERVLLLPTDLLGRIHTPAYFLWVSRTPSAAEKTAVVA
jgi:hypothetical protein